MPCARSLTTGATADCDARPDTGQDDDESQPGNQHGRADPSVRCRRSRRGNAHDVRHSARRGIRASRLPTVLLFRSLHTAPILRLPAASDRRDHTFAEERGGPRA